MIKLVAIDLDGTLLNKQMEISKENLEAIKKAQELGIKIVIATGRPYVFTKVFNEILHLDTPYIMFNGAMVRNLETNDIISNHTLSKETVLKTLTLLEDTSTPYMVYSDDVVYYKPCDRVSYLMKMSKKIREEIRASFVEVEDFHELANTHDFNKILVVEQDKTKYEKIHASLSNIKDNFDICRSSSFYIEVIPPGISKKEGIKTLSEYYNISPNEIMALGDQENDVEMISYVKYGIAMGNAIEQVKEVSYDVTLSNEESGVSHTIKKYILNK